MKTKIIEITPEIAKKTLEQNTRNRTVRRMTVAAYAEAMRSGLWKENGEPIIIGKNNIVLDGQHRLLAIIESGMTLKMVVVFDVEDSTRDTIDTGIRRTPGDALSIEGIQNGNRVSACIVGLAHSVRGYITPFGSIPRELIINAYIENELQVNNAINATSRAKSASGFSWEPAWWMSSLVIVQHTMTIEQYHRSVEVMCGFNVSQDTFSDRALRAAKKITNRNEAFAGNAALKTVIGMGSNRYASPAIVSKIVNQFKDLAGPATIRLLEWKVGCQRK